MTEKKIIEKSKFSENVVLAYAHHCKDDHSKYFGRFDVWAKNVPRDFFTILGLLHDEIHFGGLYPPMKIHHLGRSKWQISKMSAMKFRKSYIWTCHLIAVVWVHLWVKFQKIFFEDDRVNNYWKKYIFGKRRFSVCTSL